MADGIWLGLVLFASLAAPPGADAAAPDAKLEEQVTEREAADDYPEAIRLQKVLLARRTKANGNRHWETADARWDLKALEKVAGLPPAERAGWRAATQGREEAGRLEQRARYSDARPKREEFLGVCRRILGEGHPSTALGYSGLGNNLQDQGRLAEAGPLFEKALAIYRRTLGEDHPDTAFGYRDLGSQRNALGRYSEAEQLFRRALDVRRRVLGEDHAATAGGYNDLAFNLGSQGRYAEAAPLYQKALDVWRNSLGEEDSRTAAGYNNLAFNLMKQGRPAEAAALYQRALEVRRKTFGDNHPATAQAYNNLALNLQAQGRFGEAGPLFQKALDIRRKTLGEDHPATADGYSNVARNFECARQFAEAGRLYRKALDIYRKAFGPDHPATADGYNNVAYNLEFQARYGAAETLYRKALEIWRRDLGDAHPSTGAGYNNLARNLDHQGRHQEAGPFLQKALDVHRRALGDGHPDTARVYLRLAVHCHAAGRYSEALGALEQGVRSYEMARLGVAAGGLRRAEFSSLRSPYALAADCHARLGRPEAAWAALEADLARGLLDDLLAHAVNGLRPEETRQRDELATQRSGLAARILALVRRADRSPADEAELEGLLEQRRQSEERVGELAAAVSRRAVASLDQIRQALPVDGALVAWVDVFDPAGPVEGHWACAVRRGVSPRWERVAGAGPAGAWTYEDSALTERLRTLLSGPSSAAEVGALARQLYRQRLAPLEKYLEGVKHLYVAPVGKMATVPVEALTDRYTISYLPSGTFLARLRDIPRPSGHRLLAVGDPAFPPPRPASPPTAMPPGESFAELPGTRVEVASLADLFAAKSATVLTRGSATEARLEDLRHSGELAEYPFVHFATHGLTNENRAFESALVLTPPETAAEVHVGQPYLDGRLTAAEVLEYWKLDAELVTLSACDSGLGKQGGGDGLLGFAQAFLLAGSRSVCLTLWRVDDTATALLMDRFYRNLLGKRENRARPMGKAAALHEAKRWPRDLTEAEATERLGGLTAGVLRGERPARLEMAPVPQAKGAGPDSKPYAHPRYWAAFVLFGDPQ